MTDVDAICDAVLAAPKYRTIHRAVVARIAREHGARRPADAIKAVKRELHRVVGAYAPIKPRYDRWLTELAADPGEASLRDLLARHASTRERLDHLDVLLTAALAHLPAAGTLLDLGCGWMPLARSLTGVPADARYLACDVDTASLAFVRDASVVLGTPCETFPADLVADDLPAADVAILLKTLPLLDGGGRWRPILEGIPAPVVFVSFPTQSLGGRGKGMADTYGAKLRAATAGWGLEEVRLPAELGFVVAKGAR